MAGIASLLIGKALADATLAGTAAKGTVNMMNNNDKTSPILDDGLLSKSETKTENKETPEYKTLSKDQIDDLMYYLTAGGLSGPEAKEVARTGYISEAQLKKLSPDVFGEIEKLTGVSMAFPTGSKPEGTPPVTGSTVKRTTRTETPDGEVKETTTTFDSTAGGKKSTGTEIPDDDLKDLMSSINLIHIKNPKDITSKIPEIQEYSKRTGKDVEAIVRDLQRWVRTNKSLENGIAEKKFNSQKNTRQVSNIHGKTATVDNGDVMPSHMSKAEQNQVRHAAQERLARTILRNEERAKEGLLHKDEIK